jgi:hypothetical protein
VDPIHRPELSKLATEFHTRAQTAFDRIFSANAVGPGRELSLENVRQLREKAGEYSLGLYGYWSYVKERLSDIYIYRGGGKVDELSEVFAPLKPTETRLEKQLKDWAEVTSPYGDSYDVARIEDVGRELSQTLKIASAYLTNTLKDLPKGEKGQRDASFNGAMLVTISGLAEQIGSRMGDLGSGKKVPNVTLSNETIELMNRAGRDDAKFKLASLFDAVSTTRDALKGLKQDYVQQHLEEHFRIQSEIDGLTGKHKDDPDFPERLKKLNEQLEAVGLASLFDALDQHTRSRGDEELKKAYYEFKSLNRELLNPKREPPLTPGEVWAEAQGKADPAEIHAS